MAWFGRRWIRRAAREGDFLCPLCSPPEEETAGITMGRSRRYREHRSRRFLVFFGIPLVPVGGSVRSVECHACRSTFRANGTPIPELEPGHEVTDRSVRRVLAFAQLARSMSGMRDEQPGYRADADRRAIREAYRQLRNRVLPPEEADREVDEVCRLAYRTLAGQPFDVAGLDWEAAKDSAARSRILMRVEQEVRHLLNERDRDASAFFVDLLHDYLRGILPYLNRSGRETIVRAVLLLCAADGVFQQEERDIVLRVADALGASLSDLKSLLKRFLQSA